MFRPKRVIFHLLQLTLLGFGIFLTLGQVFAENQNPDAKSNLLLEVGALISPQGLQRSAYDTLLKSENLKEVRNALTQPLSACGLIPSALIAWEIGIADALSGKKPFSVLAEIQKSKEKPCEKLKEGSLEANCCLTSNKIVSENAFQEITPAILPAEPGKKLDESLEACQNDSDLGARFGEQKCNLAIKDSFKILQTDSDGDGILYETCEIPLDFSGVKFPNCFTSSFWKTVDNIPDCRESLKAIELASNPSDAVSSSAISASTNKDSAQSGNSPTALPSNGSLGK